MDQGVIQPNGNLLVNEMFMYTFDGNFTSVTMVELGFIKDGDLRPPDMKWEDATFLSPFSLNDDTKTIFYAYELKNAV
jgi:hypothetical protein